MGRHLPWGYFTCALSNAANSWAVQIKDRMQPHGAVRGRIASPANGAPQSPAKPVANRPHRAVDQANLQPFQARNHITLTARWQLPLEPFKDLAQQRLVDQMLRFTERAQAHWSGTHLVAHTLHPSRRASPAHRIEHRVEHRKQIQTQVIPKGQLPPRIRPSRRQSPLGNYLIQRTTKMNQQLELPQITLIKA